MEAAGEVIIVTAVSVDLDLNLDVVVGVEEGGVAVAVEEVQGEEMEEDLLEGEGGGGGDAVQGEDEVAIQTMVTSSATVTATASTIIRMHQCVHFSYKIDAITDQRVDFIIQLHPIPMGSVSLPQTQTRTQNKKRNLDHQLVLPTPLIQNGHSTLTNSKPSHLQNKPKTTNRDHTRTSSDHSSPWTSSA